VCWKDLPQGAQDTYQHVNVIDNNTK
jgi:hypothetical protein